MYIKELPKTLPEPEIDPDIYANDIISLLSACFNWCSNGIELASETADETDVDNIRLECVRFAYNLRSIRNSLAEGISKLDPEFLPRTVEEEKEREIRCALAL